MAGFLHRSPHPRSLSLAEVLAQARSSTSDRSSNLAEILAYGKVYGPDGDTPSSIFSGYITLNPRLVDEAWDAYDVDTRVQELSSLPERLHFSLVSQLHLALFQKRDETERHSVAR